MRAIALCGVVIPVVAAWVAVPIYGESVASWMGCAAAGVALLALAAWHRRSIGLLALGYVLAAVAALMTGPARFALERSTPSEFPFFDLSASPLPDDPPQFVAVHGYFRTEWVLDEYAVAPGERPDQSKAPPAALVPFAATEKDPVDLGSAIVVARVRPGDLKPGEPTTIRGRTAALEPELLSTLLAVATEGEPPSNARAIVVDTLVAVDDARTGLILALLALLGGAVCVFFATRPETTGGGS